MVVMILSTIAFFYCFIFVDKKGKGWQAKMKRFLYDGIPGFILSCITKVCGETAAWAVERGAKYLCFEANPLIQFFYLFLAVGGYYMYVVYGFIHVPNPYVANYHKYNYDDVASH